MKYDIEGAADRALAYIIGMVPAPDVLLTRLSLLRLGGLETARVPPTKKGFRDAALAEVQFFTRLREKLMSEEGRFLVAIGRRKSENDEVIPSGFHLLSKEDSVPGVVADAVGKMQRKGNNGMSLAKKHNAEGMSTNDYNRAVDAKARLSFVQNVLAQQAQKN